jgi:hypothetical protein
LAGAEATPSAGLAGTTGVESEGLTVGGAIPTGDVGAVDGTVWQATTPNASPISTKDRHNLTK